MRAKLRFVLSITILFGSFYGVAQQDYWQRIIPNAATDKSGFPDDNFLYKLDHFQFQKVVGKTTKTEKTSIQFPNGEGTLDFYQVWQTPVFHPDLSRKYPEIKSFTGVSKDGTSKIRFSYSPKGLQATIMDIGNGDPYFLEPIKDGKGEYRVYQSDVKTRKNIFECSTPNVMGLARSVTGKNLVDGQVLRTYRIAVSTTGEYTNYHGGTIAGALAAINATLTRVNMVFETDLAVTLELVPNNDQVIFTDAASDPYTGSFNAQVQNTLTSIIGEENYDVGHLFHRDNDNGNAGFIGSVCVDNRKGSAFASALIPEGDLFDLDYVAHELGHQFGANHTWSFESEGTGVQVEPASGTTIMGYAGIVAGNNVAPNGDDYFHHLSIVQIQEYLQTTGCSVDTNLSNTPPQIIPQQDYSIPVGTAFVLSGPATDPDGDLLTYTWEQIDNGVVVATTFGPDNTSGANFRSLPPSINPERYFPLLSRVLSGDLEQVNPVTNDAWETVSNVKRNLNFALTVRDNNPEGGQVASDSVRVEVINTAGPFRVTSQSTAEVFSAGSVQTIMWDVANTNRAPINAELVDVVLSTDGGATFSEVLAQGIPNTGNAQIQLPGTATTNGRIMVRASNNIFLAVNSSNFTIEGAPAILNFDQLDFSSCQPDDIIVPFVYEAYEGFSETMDLSITSSQPFTANFSQSSVSTNDTMIDLTLGNISNIPVGTHTVEVVATGQSFSTSTTLEIKVFESTFDTVALTFPPDLAVGTNVNPEFRWLENVNYSAFDIEIALDEEFASIIESSTVSIASYQSSLLVPETQYFWRVRPKNPCGDGTFGTPFGFTTSVVNCADFDANDPPQEISSEGTPTVTATTFLAEDLRIADINVNVEISHTFLEDLTVSLISPAGTKVTLISKNCGNLNNIIAVFDDSGSPLECSGNPAIGGIVQPLGSLSSFNGESTLGEWTLEIQDTAASDGGALDAFSLEICVEGTFRPDDDEDGVFDDGDDLCLGTPKGTLVDTSGCPLNAFPATNFSVSIQSEACRANNDGSIIVLAMDTTLDYEATLTGNGIDTSNQFMEQTTFSNLSAGTYQLCITGTDGLVNFRETCFEVIVDEPPELSVLANLLTDGQTVRLQMSGGQLYTIELNGLVDQTTGTSFSVNLKPGLNTLKITTGLSCQGVFERQFFVAVPPVIFPNPATALINISSRFQDQEVRVNIYSAEGRLIRQKKIWAEGHTFDLNVSELSNGLYYIVLEAMGLSQTSKLIKR
ncbi:MAG: reprolysin-like metallopeptidase [Bacteroidota bacterium]